MRIWTLAATVMMAGTMIAAPIARGEEAAPKTEVAEVKPIEVRICPMSNTPVDGDGAGNRIVKNYKVFFC